MSKPRPPRKIRPTITFINQNVPKPVKKSKPVIEDIVISQEKLAEFNSELKSSSVWDKNKRGIIKKYLGWLFLPLLFYYQQYHHLL